MVLPRMEQSIQAPIWILILADFVDLLAACYRYHYLFWFVFLCLCLSLNIHISYLYSFIFFYVLHLSLLGCCVITLNIYIYLHLFDHNLLWCSYVCVYLVYCLCKYPDSTSWRYLILICVSLSLYIHILSFDVYIYTYAFSSCLYTFMISEVFGYIFSYICYHTYLLYVPVQLLLCTLRIIWFLYILSYVFVHDKWGFWIYILIYMLPYIFIICSLYCRYVYCYSFIRVTYITSDAYFCHLFILISYIIIVNCWWWYLSSLYYTYIY
jgi:hypothetical protein